MCQINGVKQFELCCESGINNVCKCSERLWYVGHENRGSSWCWWFDCLVPEHQSVNPSREVTSVLSMKFEKFTLVHFVRSALNVIIILLFYFQVDGHSRKKQFKVPFSLERTISVWLLLCLLGFSRLTSDKYIYFACITRFCLCKMKNNIDCNSGYGNKS